MTDETNGLDSECSSTASLTFRSGVGSIHSAAHTRHTPLPHKDSKSPAMRAGQELRRACSTSITVPGRSKLRRCLCIRGSSTVTAPPSTAAPVVSQYQLVDLREQCRALRKQLSNEMLSGGLIYLAGGEEQLRNGSDVFHKFRPHSDFAYVTGVTEPGFACVLDPESGGFTLLAPRVPEDAAVWWGGLPSLEQLAEDSGADRCIYQEDLRAFLHTRPNAGRMVHTVKSMKKALQAVSADAKVSSAFLPAALKRSREKKTDAEIACLLHANHGSGAAHTAMWRAAAPGMYEYQLEAVFAAETLSRGLPQFGYPAIVGSGPNAAILHYGRNSKVCQDGELVLVDAGAECRYYTADITRTFPVNGTFSPQQREVYQAVLDMQELGLGLIRPGAVWKDIDAACRKLMLQRLLEMGLVHGSIESLLAAKVDRIFMPHGLGHFLGLDVHDEGEAGPVPKVLQERHVVTCEPGLYFMPLLLDQAAAKSDQAAHLKLDRLQQFTSMGGVRIEDNCAVVSAAAGSCFNLTVAAGVPKTIQEVEAIAQS